MYGKDRFICPHCNTAAQQGWYRLYRSSGRVTVDAAVPSFIEGQTGANFKALSVCHYCDGFAYWVGGTLKHPVSDSPIAEPNIDLPDEIKSIYNEARGIFLVSPRSSAALLRLAMENMLTLSGYTQGRLVEKINALVESEGATEELIMAVEIIRLYGNSSAHTGFIDLNDDKESAEQLFTVLNIIAEHKYTRPKRLRELMDSMPESKRRVIAEKLEKLQS